MNGLLNMMSLILGLCAWTIPIYILVKKNLSFRKAKIGILASSTCALFSLLMQMMGTNRMIARMDWAALMDTQGSVVFCAVVLVLLVSVLNGLVLFRLVNPGLAE